MVQLYVVMLHMSIYPRHLVGYEVYFKLHHILELDMARM